MPQARRGLRKQKVDDVERRQGRRLLRPFGRREPRLSRAITGQLRAAHEGALIARAMVDRQLDPAMAREQIADVEHQGDEMRREFVAALSTSLVTPLDREDLFRLSRSIDDVLDTIRDFVREADLYRIEKRRTFRPFMEPVVTAIEVLAEAVAMLWIAPDRAALKALDVKKCARSISRAYQNEFANIVHRELSTHTLKRRELIKRLDWVGVRIGEAADALADGALKRGF